MNMTTDSKISQFIKESKEYIKNNHLKSYCICLYIVNNSYHYRYIRYIFKNLKEFENKVKKYIEKIDEGYGIQFETREFD